MSLLNDFFLIVYEAEKRGVFLGGYFRAGEQGNGTGDFIGLTRRHLRCLLCLM
jgi:hypothetical protein